MNPTLILELLQLSPGTEVVTARCRVEAAGQSVTTWHAIPEADLMDAATARGASTWDETDVCEVLGAELPEGTALVDGIVAPEPA